MPRSKKHTAETTPKKHAGGRPKVQLSDLPTNWKNIILDASRQGKGEVEIRCDLGEASSAEGSKICFSNDLWYRLIKDNKEFSDTIKMGELLCERWWKDQGRLALHDKDSFNHGLWYMNMKNRFKWHDRQEQILSGSVKTHVDLRDLRESYGRYKKSDKK